MPQMSLINMMHKGAESDYETEKAWIWQDDAACAFQPASMFEVAFPGDRITEDTKTLNEVHDLNETNLRAAQKICGTCPVFDLCYTSAEPEDFRWTMRAGVMPTAHNITALGRPAKTNTCPEGHVGNWTTDRNGHRRCVSCDNARSIRQAEEQKAKRAAEGRTKRTVEPIARGKRCRLEHDEWKPRKDGGWTCVPCKRAADLRRVHRLRGTAKVGG